MAQCCSSFPSRSAIAFTSSHSCAPSSRPSRERIRLSADAQRRVSRRRSPPSARARPAPAAPLDDARRSARRARRPAAAPARVQAVDAGGARPQAHARARALPRRAASEIRVRGIARRVARARRRRQADDAQGGEGAVRRPRAARRGRFERMGVAIANGDLAADGPVGRFLGDYFAKARRARARARTRGSLAPAARIRRSPRARRRRASSRVLLRRATRHAAEPKRRARAKIKGPDGARDAVRGLPGRGLPLGNAARGRRRRPAGCRR